MAHAQKPDLVFQRKGRVHLNRQGCQFILLLAAEVCGSAHGNYVGRVPTYRSILLATHSIHVFPLHFLSRASPCAIRFWTRYTSISQWPFHLPAKYKTFHFQYCFCFSKERRSELIWNAITAMTDIDWHWVRALTVPMHLGLTDGPLVPHNLISTQESPSPLLKFQMAPRLKILCPLGPGKEARCAFLFSQKSRQTNALQVPQKGPYGMTDIT